jgi:hypothetical protein
MEKNSNIKVVSGVLAFLASVFLLVYVFQISKGITSAVLYIGITLLAFALVSYIVGFVTSSSNLKYFQLTYLITGLSMMYAEVMLSGGKNTFLYLAIFTALIAGLVYLAASYGLTTGAPRRTGVRAH